MLPVLVKYWYHYHVSDEEGEDEVDDDEPVEEENVVEEENEEVMCEGDKFMRWDWVPVCRRACD